MPLSVLHTAWLFGRTWRAAGASAFVEGLGVETDSAIDISNLWVGSIALDINLPLDLDPSELCYGPLDAFLRVRGGFDIEGGKDRPATAADAFQDADLPIGTDLDQ